MRPYIVGENLTGITISEKDTPELGGYVAVSGDDKWYVSKDYFNANYELAEDLLNSSLLVTGLSFGGAVEALKAGLKVSRAGWNGKGMYLTLIFSGNAMHQGYAMQDCVGMKTANNLMQPGWLASQNDILAEDWEIVE